MRRHQVRARTAGIVAALSLAVTSPAWADCCSSFLGCAATYVTDGLSCEIETLIDTQTSIGSMITNFIHDIDGQTQSTLVAAQQEVSGTHDQMQSQSQTSESDLAAALTQAQALYKQEVDHKAFTDQSMAQQQNGLTTQASGTTAQPRPQVEARADSQPPTSGPPLAMSVQKNQNVGPASGPGNPLMQKTTVNVGTQMGVSPDLVSTPPGSFADAFSRAIQQIQVLKTAGDADFSQVSGYLQQALNSEAPGVAQANSLANVMMAPMTAMQSAVSDMLSHPLSAFDPSSVVDSIEATINADLSTNNATMYSDITTAPNAQFAAAQPSYDDLLANAQAAQTLLMAMTDAYQRRTTAAANALYAALPTRHFQGTDAKGITGTAFAANNMAAKFGQRVPFAVIAANISTVQQRAKLAYKAPNTSQLHAAVAQFKAQRAQGKTMPPATLAGYKSKLSQQFDGMFTGKSSAAIASQRDQLIGQAKSQYAKYPSTENAVIGLLNSEASKYGSTASATTTNPTIPGQPVAASVAQRSAVPVNSQLGLAAPASSSSSFGAAPSSLGATSLGSVAPVAAPTGLSTLGTSTTTGAVQGWARPAANAPAMTTGTMLANPTVPGQPVPSIAQPAAQVKTPAWGTAPAQGWAQPAAAAAPSLTTVAPVIAPAAAPAAVPAANPALRFQAVKPLQQQTQQTETATTLINH
jgi:hypothetical protein